MSVFKGESLMGRPVHQNIGDAALLFAEGVAHERARFLAALREDESLWGDLCGYIAPEQAATGTIRSILRRAADYLERQQ